jgi:predicted PurR-regulated permease PerM
MNNAREPMQAKSESAPSTTAMRVLALVLALAGLWVARAFLLQIAFAVILAVAIWPLYCRLSRRAVRPERTFFLPLAFTLAVGAILILPFAVVATEAMRDSDSVARWLIRATRSGVPPPDWLGSIPAAGRWLVVWWNHNLADPRGAAELLGRIDAGAVVGWTAWFAGGILSWAMFILVTLLALFITLRDGGRGAAAACQLARRLYGTFGERFVTRLAEAIHGTVNGTIFVAFSEGALIGLGYRIAGLAHPLAFTVVTIGFALVPFGAWAAFGVASLVLVLQGQALTGALLFVYGSAIMLTGDNLIQPALIGNSIRLPFLWTFVGIFGGMYSFGLVGLFIGPAIMAALYLVWSEWQGLEPSRGRRAGKGNPVVRSEE